MEKLRCPMMVKVAGVRESLSNFFSRPNPYGHITNSEIKRFKAIHGKLETRQKITEKENADFNDYTNKLSKRMGKPERILPAIGVASGAAGGLVNRLAGGSLRGSAGILAGVTAGHAIVGQLMKRRGNKQLEEYRKRKGIA